MPDVFCLIHTRFHLNEIGDSLIQQLDSYTLDPIIDWIITLKLGEKPVY